MKLFLYHEAIASQSVGYLGPIWLLYVYLKVLKITKAQNIHPIDYFSIGSKNLLYLWTLSQRSHWDVRTDYDSRINNESLLTKSCSTTCTNIGIDNWHHQWAGIFALIIFITFGGNANIVGLSHSSRKLVGKA